MARVLIVAGLGSSLLRFRGDLIKSWLDMGHQVFAAAPGNDIKFELAQMDVVYHDIPLERTGLNLLSDLRLALTLRRLILMHKPEYLFLYTIKPVIYGSLSAFLCRKVKVFSMITGLGYVFTGNPKQGGCLKNLVVFLYRLALKRNQAVLFQNPDDEHFFIENKIVSTRKVNRVNGSGVNVDYFYYVEPLINPVCFLLIARLLKEKGIMEYVEAARLIRMRYPDTKFRIVGWVFEKNPSAIDESLLKQWSEEGIVELTGETDDVRPYIAEASVYVLPSYREGTPRTVLEAMAMGRPIITTDAPGCRETVIEGVNGYMVPVKDHISLAQVMEQFILEPELIIRMGVESRRLAETKYDVHKVNLTINRIMGLV
jgi:glycosyltransferase involved in cell wall biosynthesis